MKIVSFFPPTISGSDFGNLLSASLIEKQGEFFLICAEYTKFEEKKSDFAGLELALNIDRGEKPMVICSFMSEQFFLQDSRLSGKFSALMAQKRVAFMRLPFSSTELYKEYLDLLEDEKKEDLLAIKLNEIATYDDIMATIRHRIAHLQKSNLEKDNKIVNEAVLEARSKLRLTGTDQEVIIQIVNFKSSKTSPFAGTFFPGVFCDIENTLLINGQVNEEMFLKLQELSETEPITLWTGAVLEIDSIRKKLIQKGISWKVVPKTMFSGAEVEIAFDDEGYEEFYKKYNVKARSFNKI